MLELLKKKLEILKVVKQYTDCWELKIPRKKDKESFIKIEGSKLYRAARVSAAIYLGMELHDPYHRVEQICKNKGCWNPEHLRVLKV